jgi:hypothetical protein
LSSPDDVREERFDRHQSRFLVFFIVVVDAERKARRKGLTRKRRHDPRSGEASARRERRSIGGWGVWRAYEGALDDSNVSSIVR